MKIDIVRCVASSVLRKTRVFTSLRSLDMVEQEGPIRHQSGSEFVPSNRGAFPEPPDVRRGVAFRRTLHANTIALNYACVGLNSSREVRRF